MRKYPFYGNHSSVMEFKVGKVKGSCVVHYRPPQYEPPNMICYPEEVEFTHVDVNGKYIPFENINDVLNNIMLKTFEKVRHEDHYL
jgi:hypothetical protein